MEKEEIKQEQNELVKKALEEIKASNKTIPAAAVAFVAFKTADQFIDKEANPSLEEMYKLYAKCSPETAHVHTVKSLYESFIVTLYATFFADQDYIDKLSKHAKVKEDEVKTSKGANA